MEVVNPKILWKDYTYISGQTNAIKDHFNLFAKKTIKRFNLSKNDLIVDIGSNDGSLLNYFKKKKSKFWVLIQQKMLLISLIVESIPSHHYSTKR